MSSQRATLRQAGSWFLESGILESSGGVARYHLSDSRRNAPVSNEITGYSVSALVYCYEQTGDRSYLDAAHRAARFLVDTAWDRHSSTFPFEPVSNGDPAHAYFFDCGIIARGLMAIWRSTGDRSYLERAIETALSMAFDFISDEAAHPVLTLPDKQPVEYGARWSRRPGCYQLKSAMAWHDLARVTCHPKMNRAYDRVLAYSLATHEQFLPGDGDQERVMDRLHAYAYFLEGLLPVAARPECAAALRDGIPRLAEYLRAIAPVFARSDVYAQLLRVRLFADQLGALALDSEAAEEEASRIAEFQLDAGPHAGGFWFGKKGGAFLPFVNPVSTAFCAQALTMWRQSRAGDFNASVTDLV